MLINLLGPICQCQFTFLEGKRFCESKVPCARTQHSDKLLSCRVSHICFLGWFLPTIFYFNILPHLPDQFASLYLLALLEEQSHREHKVSCSRTQHNAPIQGWNEESNISSPRLSYFSLLRRRRLVGLVIQSSYPMEEESYCDEPEKRLHKRLLAYVT